MSAKFSIKIDWPRNLLRATLEGFFSVEDVCRYHAEVNAASARLKPPTSSQSMICDVSGMLIQPQDVIVAFGRVMGDPQYQKRRVAFVLGSSLARMQLRRLLDGHLQGSRDARAFPTTAEAEDWLFGSSRAADVA